MASDGLLSLLLLFGLIRDVLVHFGTCVMRFLRFIDNESNFSFNLTLTNCDFSWFQLTRLNKSRRDLHDSLAQLIGDTNLQTPPTATGIATLIMSFAIMKQVH